MNEGSVVICHACGKECEAWMSANQGTTFPRILSKCCNAGTSNVPTKGETWSASSRSFAVALKILVGRIECRWQLLFWGLRFWNNKDSFGYQIGPLFVEAYKPEHIWQEIDAARRP